MLLGKSLQLIIMNKSLCLYGRRIVNFIILLMLIILVIAPATILAADGEGEGSIMDRINQAQGGSNVSALQEKASEIGESFVKFLRTTAIMIAVIMFIVVAYALLFSPNVRTIADMKGRIGALVLAIIISVMAEQIVGTLLSWVGYSG